MNLEDTIVNDAIVESSDWDITKKGKYLPTYNNCMMFIDQIEVDIKYNSFASFIEINGHRYQDLDTIRMKELMRKMKLEPSVKTIDEAVHATALKNKYHPVLDYLNTLEWDGTKRLNSWLTDFCGVPKCKYSEFVSRLALLAPIYRVYEPGCQYDTMIILEGDQGIGKSRLVRVLGGDWYKAISLLGHDHNTVQLMKSAWIIEVAELSVFAKRDIESLRAFLSNPVDSARFAYARNDVVIPRQSAFIGTINPDSNGYLMDATGNRRFLPVFLSKVDIEGLSQVRDQLFAEAVSMYRDKVPIHIDNKELDDLVLQNQKAREFHDDWSNLIINYVNITKSSRDFHMTANEVFVQAIGGENKNFNKAVSIRVGNILKKLGCEAAKSQSLNGIFGRYYNLANLQTKYIPDGIPDQFPLDFEEKGK